MDNLKLKKVCPLPWLHLSAHLDSTMRICCNTDGPGFVVDNNGQTIKMTEVSDIHAFFNLDYYKHIRSQMLKGEEPEQCRKCYQVEEFGGESVRNTYIKVYGGNGLFLKSLAMTDVETGEILPLVQSLDLSLSNVCNLKCVMCSPAASYLIKSDYDKIGLDYSKEFTEGAHKNWRNNPSLEKIIPQIAPTLKNFLTTGGEPFLNEEHYRILELIVDLGKAGEVNLSYHTNCTVKNTKLFEIWNKFKSVSVHFSIDAFGELNEYVRFKTKWSDVVENVKLISSHPKAKCEVHTTVHALNIFNLPALYEWIKSIPGIPIYPYHIWMDQPVWLRMDVLPPEYLQRAIEKLEGYFTLEGKASEWDKIRRDQILSYLKRSMLSYQGQSGLENFKKLVRQFEQIRKTPAIETLVPELRELFS